jgi:chitinase
MDRPCLNMEVNEIDTTKYTHIHFSFALVSPDYKVDVSAVQDQFEKLVKMKGIKRILSFGGWSFSTSQDSYPIFRESVSNQIRMAFANEVAAFIRDHDLDGVDFDWEYPGAPDIPGLPPGSPNDGINYLSFLKLVRGVLPAEKTVSIAAPASYWYLKGFPIKEIAEVVDYIIYMTYDLHGQWDYGSPWASPGCTSGACLRSHVNLTETINGLSMITKAGVPAAKVIVGVSSYGRSFKMLQAGCIGPNCLFVGPASEAAPGACTRTPGYISDGEIARISASNPSAQNYHDAASDSNILVYDSTQWVAYMDAKTKAGRIAQYKALNFGGTSDWAVDLAGYAVDDPIATQDCTKWIGLTIDDLIRYRDQESIPYYCIDAIIITAQSNALNEALVNYEKMLANEYDKKFETYASFIKTLVPLQMNEWMAEHGSDHFDCSVTKHVTCCHDCTSFCSPCDNSPNCKQGIQAVPVPCPSVFPDGPGIHQSLEKYTFTVKNLDAFRQALSTDTSIPTDWFVLGDVLAGIDPACAGGGPASNTCEAKIYWHGVPVPTAFTIPNPKAYITPRPNDLRPFARLLDDASMNVRHYTYGEDTGKVIAAATLPIIMMKYALESMALVDRTASAVEHDRLKYSIACFISAILILIPAVGEVLEATEITTLVGFGAGVSTVGEAADHIVVLMSLLQDPKSWYKELFAAIIEIPLGEGGETMEIASEIYLSRGQSNIAGLGLNVTNEVGKIQRMREFCSFSDA